MQKRGKTALTLVGFAVMLAAMVSIGAGKDGFDIDEFFTYGLANSYHQPFLSTQTGSWISGKAFSDYLTAKGHAHEYLNVYENQIADVHPPLYYLFMHAVCSAFQNPPFTKWTGIGLNLFFFSLTQFGLLLLSARLLSDGEKLELTPPALLPGLLYGLSAGAASGVVFIRMYAMMTMWAVWLALALAELFIHGQTVWRMRALAAVLIVANYREFITRIDWSAVFDMRPIRRFLVVNRDIIVRTLCIVAVYTFFTGASARMEDRTLLAVNPILLQLFTLFSYMTDGFAQAAEALDVLRRTIHAQQLGNITPLQCDLLTSEDRTQYDAMLFCFFGSLAEILPVARRQCAKTLIVIKKNYDLHRFSLTDQPIRGETASAVCETLREMGVPFEFDAQELEHGQPQEGQRQNHQAADGPDLARQPMGIGPVVLVSQGPGQANAHGIGLFALGQVVAHRQEHQAQEQTSHQVDVHRQRQGLGIGHSPAEQRDQRANPQQ